MTASHYHPCAEDQCAAHAGPFDACDAVMAEPCFLLARAGFDPAVALQFIERGVVQLPFSLQDQIGAVRHLFERYDNVPAALADASLIRLSELIDRCALLTLDSDFAIYRRHGRKPIPLIRPLAV